VAGVVLDGEVGSGRVRSVARPAHSDDAKTIERLTRGERHKPIRKYTAMNEQQRVTLSAFGVLDRGAGDRRTFDCLGTCSHVPPPAVTFGFGPVGSDGLYQKTVARKEYRAGAASMLRK
jgi:hypothetical protein